MNSFCGQVLIVHSALSDSIPGPQPCPNEAAILCGCGLGSTYVGSVAPLTVVTCLDLTLPLGEGLGWESGAPHLTLRPAHTSPLWLAMCRVSSHSLWPVTHGNMLCGVSMLATQVAMCVARVSRPVQGNNWHGKCKTRLTGIWEMLLTVGSYVYVLLQESWPFQ